MYAKSSTSDDFRKIPDSKNVLFLCGFSNEKWPKIGVPVLEKCTKNRNSIAVRDGPSNAFAVLENMYTKSVKSYCPDDISTGVHVQRRRVFIPIRNFFFLFPFS